MFGAPITYHSPPNPCIVCSLQAHVSCLICTWDVLRRLVSSNSARRCIGGCLSFPIRPSVILWITNPTKNSIAWSMYPNARPLTFMISLTNTVYLHATHDIPPIGRYEINTFTDPSNSTFHIHISQGINARSCTSNTRSNWKASYRAPKQFTMYFISYREFGIEDKARSLARELF